MGAHKLSFFGCAQTLGYNSEDDMFRDLYLIQGFSIKEVSKVLGIAGWVVRNRLIGMKIPLRPRGGLNNFGNRKLACVPDKELMKEKTAELCKKYKVHQSTVFAERRTRRTNGGQAVVQRPSQADQDATGSTGGVPASDGEPSNPGTVPVRTA